MKRFIASFLMLLYVASVSGATFNVHFCGNKLQAVSFAGFEHKVCCCGKSKAMSNCCKNKTVSIKTGKEHKQVSILSTPLSIPKIIASEVPSFLCLNLSDVVAELHRSLHSPPIRAADAKLFLLNSVFRI
ncbi:MAG: hypothetical protein M3R17_01155 [Bacteroidota bacterium]|nr:hypothetical protein [Bacteroidota bacterium]